MGHIAKMVHSLETALDAAIYIELRGRDLFMAARDRAKDPELASLFSFLAGEEDSHLSLYRELLQRLGNDSSDQDFAGGYGKFIQAITDDVLQSLDSLENLSAEECISAALQFEKDTLLFFQEIKSLLKEPDANVIERICKEEKEHVLRLMDYRNKREKSSGR